MRYFIYCRKSSESEDRQILSIDSQKAELEAKFGSLPDVEIVEIFEESYSAKAPGRTIFSEVMRRLQKGDADGLIAWHPDRLSRNSVDAGHIIYLLDRKHHPGSSVCNVYLRRYARRQTDAFDDSQLLEILF